MSDMREELERLRRDVDQLLARLPAAEAQAPPEQATTGQVNEALVRYLRGKLRSEGKTRGIAICRVVVKISEGGTGICSGIITSSSAADFEEPTRLGPSVVALATDPLALRAVRKLVQPFFDGRPMRMTREELAEALGASESDIEKSLQPLVSDETLQCGPTESGGAAYEIQDAEPHLLLLQSLETG